MALRDQPYIPLYVQDIMTDEKLNECSAATHGIYIKGIMCLMHKSEEYGKLKLKQKHKQSGSKTKDFASMVAKHLPYTLLEITAALEELLAEDVVRFDGDYLIQKRMVRDGEISSARAKAGYKGGKQKPSKPKSKTASKAEANSEYESVYENEDIIVNNNGNENYFVIIKDRWFQIYQKAKNTKPSFGAIEGRTLKSLIQKIKDKHTEKKVPWTAETAVASFEAICAKALEDKWMGNNFDLKMINSKFDIIYGKASNQHSDSEENARLAADIISENR